MVVPLLTGTAKTLVVSMLSERVLLGVLVMLSEWAAAKSTNSLDDRLVIEMKTKSSRRMGKSKWSAYITPSVHFRRGGLCG